MEKKSKKRGLREKINRIYPITTNRIGKLLEVAIKQRNLELTDGEPKLKERKSKVMKQFADEYLRLMCEEITRQPVCHPFNTTGISHVQVLQKESNKGYEWDRLYNMRDFEIVMHHKYPNAKVIFDDSLLGIALDRAKNGEVYLEEISEHHRRLHIGMDEDVFYNKHTKNYVCREVRAYRMKECNVCKSNLNGVCLENNLKLADYIKLPKVECPKNEW